MNTYIAFLRGINVSGQKKIKMADLKESLQKIGLENVITYIQSGNVVFNTPGTNMSGLEMQIKEAIKEDFGMVVPIVIKTPNQILEVLDQNPFKAEPNQKGLYFTLLHKIPDHDSAVAFQKLKFKNEDFQFTATCVYLNCKKGAGKAKLNNNLIENKLKVPATTRNLNTMNKMIQLTR